MKKLYKTMKVFDCQDMPDGLFEIISSMYDYINLGNGVYICYGIHDEAFTEKDKHSDYFLEKQKLDNWLIENGAKPGKDEDSEGESVLIKYWW